MMDQTIPISLDDLKVEFNTDKELKELLARPNYARSFLYLCIQLVNNQQGHVTVIEVANAIGRARSQSQEILNRFVSLGVLSCKHKGSRIYYALGEPGYFTSHWQLAKSTIDGEVPRA